MKKYEIPEMKVLSVNTQHILAGSLYDGDNPVPGFDPRSKDFGFAEDISSDLFGGESFGGAEEW